MKRISIRRNVFFTLFTVMSLSAATSVYAVPFASSQISLDWTTLTIQTSSGFSITQGASGTDIVAESFNEPEYDYDFDVSDDWTSGVAATSGVTGANASSTADANTMQFSSTVQGPQQWSVADASGWRFLEFDAVGDGTLTVSFDYSVDLSVTTDDSNQLAAAWGDIWLDIENIDQSSTASDHAGNDIFAFDGDADFDNFTGTLTASLSFIDGESGRIWIEAETFAIQETIPEPGTLWLMAISSVSLFFTGGQRIRNSRGVKMRSRWKFPPQRRHR